jgi:hypothetical protein
MSCPRPSPNAAGTSLTIHASTAYGDIDARSL